MRVNELKEYLIILEWLDNVNTAKSTEPLHLQAMQAFTEYVALLINVSVV